MPHRTYHLQEERDKPVDAGPESPRHGFQGDRAPQSATPFVPASLTVAVSREAGSRGGSIAREGNFRQGVLDNLSPATGHWVEEHLERLRREEDLGQKPALLELARMILAL